VIVKLNGKYGGFAIVDDECWPIVSGHSWCRELNGYPKARVNGRNRAMHLHIADHFLIVPPGHQIDHANGDVCDNRLANLRVCDHTENARNRGKQKNNTSGIAGVSWHCGKWKAAICVNKRPIYLGHFSAREDAAAARLAAERRYFGEFAPSARPPRLAVDTTQGEIKRTRSRVTHKNNKSGVVGVTWHRRNMMWCAKITVNRKQISLGQFDSLIDAVAARIAAENGPGEPPPRRLWTKNTSGILGVCWRTTHEKWQAVLKVNRKTFFLGEFASLLDAAAARIAAENKYFGPPP